ncbi:MAG TPA: glycosyltransferase [Gemmataceae bacterium]|nr:glycosyltransferase [Gemmataceae bacterium]
MTTAKRHPVRVCFLIDRLTRGGTETQLLALIRVLDRTRVEPALVLLDGEDDESRSLEPADCPVLRLGVRSLHRPHALAAAARLRRFWRSHGTDVLQVYFLDSTYFGVPLARASGIRRVVRVRNNLGHWLTPKHRWLGRLMAGLADVTLTNCEPARRALIDAEGGDARKVAVLENGVDLDRFTALAFPRPGPEFVIGAVANLRPVKGIDVLVRAAARVVREHPRARFRVAGQGEQRPDLERLIAELSLRERFELIGPVSDVPAFLAGVDVAVLPSRAEGMSNALLEYMAAGRPVVATDVGANAQLLCGGDLGLLVPPGDDAALAAGLTRLIRHPVEVSRRAETARRHVTVHFSRDAMRERFEAFYERLCRGRRPAVQPVRPAA